MAVLMPEKPACVKPPVRPMRAASPALVASPGVEAAEGSNFTLRLEGPLRPDRRWTSGFIPVC